MKKLKEKNIKLAILVIALLLILTGTSYALWTYNYTGNGNQITTSQIKLQFLESTDEIINITNAVPISDDEGMTEEETFDFAVITETSQTRAIVYTLEVEKLSPDTGYTSLNDSDMKIYLEDYEGNVLLVPTLISNLTNYVFYTGTHNHNSSNQIIKDKFRLRVWIDEAKTAAAQSWTTATKYQYKFKIGVNGN